MDVIIYGAQGYALGAYNAIRVLSPDRNVLFFMVTSMGYNASFLGGLPVKEIVSVSESYSVKEKKSIEVIIATPENIQDEIEVTLERFGFSNHIRLDSLRWGDMMGKLYELTGNFPPLSYLPQGNSKSRIRIFMAKHHKDKKLRQPFELPLFMVPIQVGAANTEDIIAELRDCDGDNISTKNGNYCELTGLYWVWRNVLCGDSCDCNEYDYFGFAQYRRVLILSEEDLNRLNGNDVDVVLPYPLPYEPDISAHHERYLKDEDWKALLTALEEVHPDCSEALSRVLKQQYLYNYNVLLARKNILRDYCEWLFPILERTEELSAPKGNDRSDRYIGYMGETLETLYFLKNRDKLKIMHTGCRLLV